MMQPSHVLYLKRMIHYHNEMMSTYKYELQGQQLPRGDIGGCDIHSNQQNIIVYPTGYLLLMP